MNNKPLISIIIPVYNVEKYLDRCMESIINQTYKNIEILLIDDGSSDNSFEICKKYQNKYPYVKAFTQKNNGQGSARNKGINEAVGDLITFIDSDDYVDHRMFETLVNIKNESKADIVGCSIEVVGPKGHISFYSGDDTDKITSYTAKEALKKLCENRDINSSVCTRLYNKNIIKNNLFKEKIKYEDLDIMYKWFDAAKTIVISNRCFYKYYMSSESTLRGKLKKTRFDFINVSKERIDYYKLHHKDLVNLVVSNTIDECIHILYDARRYKEFKNERKETKQYVKSLLKEYKLEYASRKAKLKISLYKISPICYYLLMDFYNLLSNIKKGSNRE